MATVHEEVVVCEPVPGRVPGTSSSPVVCEPVPGRVPGLIMHFGKFPSVLSFKARVRWPILTALNPYRRSPSKRHLFHLLTRLRPPPPLINLQLRLGLLWNPQLLPGI
ncbi:hypothetical protein LINGRAHAP2_LOCUS31483 [Linum grandiflorum]